MAEVLQIKNNLPTKLDISKNPSSQPDGTNRFCLNAITDPRHLGAVTNEPGNQLVALLPYTEVGKIPLDRFRTILFTEDGSIYLFNSADDSLTLQVTIPDFTFSPPITGEFKVINGCEEVIYWGNNEEYDMFFNMTNPEVHQDSAGNYEASRFKLHYAMKHPVIQTEVLTYGGDLKRGVYQFAVRYLDRFSNVLFTSPIDINYSPVIESTDSIRLTISNIDDKADYLQLIVIRYASNDKVTGEAFIIDELLPATDTVRYHFTVLAPEDVFISKPELLVPNAIYESSLVKEQVGNRLLRANLKQSTRSYSNFQQYASKICTKYVVKAIPTSDPNIYWTNRTLAGGEVAAFGIVYVFEDGTISPAFHIPGRASIPTDFDDSGIVQNEEKLITYKFFDVQVFDQPPVSKRIEISYEFDTPINGLSFKLVMSDGTTVIPVGVWDEDNGTLLFIVPTGSFGSGTLEIYSDVGTYQFSVFFLFDETTPVEDKIGSAKINDGENLPVWKIFDTSLKDATPIEGYDSSGLMGYYEASQTYDEPPNYCGNGNYWGADCDGNELVGLPIRYHVIPDSFAESHYNGPAIRPKGVKFDNIEYPSDDIVGHYFVIGINGINRIVAKGTTSAFYNNDGVENAAFENGRYFWGYWPGDLFASSSSKYKNFITLDNLFAKEKIEGTFLVDESSFLLGPNTNDQEFKKYFHKDLPYKGLKMYQKIGTIYNYSPAQAVYPIEDIDTLLASSSYDGLYNRSLSNDFTIIELEQQEDSVLRYSSVRNTIEAFRNVWSIRYRRLTDLSTDVSFAGDHFISEVRLTNISWISGPSGFNWWSLLTNVTFALELLTEGDIKVEYEYIEGFYSESEVNGYIRIQSESENDCEVFIDKGGEEERNNVVAGMVTEKWENAEILGNKLRDSICRFYSGWEKHYSVSSNWNDYFPMKYSFNFCSDCIGEYPNRIIFSNESQDGDSADKYRVYSPLDFIDIPANRGSIQGLDYKNDRIIVRTQYSTFFLAPNPQQLQASESTVHIGTGAFLGIPPRELNVVDIGYGGQQHPFESINIDQGLVWIDRQRGHVHLYGGEYDNLAAGEMEPWFDYYMKGANSSIPVIMGYDPDNERLLINLGDSWTFSYCFKVKGWRSWHSYMPDTFFNDAKFMYTITNKKIRKHNSEARHFFGDTQYPHIVEYTIKDAVTFFTDSVIYYANTYQVDGFLLHENLNDTFNKIIVYNDIQSTGEQTLRLVQDSLTNVFFQAGTTNVIQTDKNYQVGPISDYATSNILWTEWTPASGIPWIDKIPANIDFNKEQSEIGDLKDKYVSVRLIYDPPVDDYVSITIEELLQAPVADLEYFAPLRSNANKIVTNLSMILQHYSIR